MDLFDQFKRNPKNKEYKEQTEKTRSIPSHSDPTHLLSDQRTATAYERYILAQFKFADPQEVDRERQEAIESLVPGSENYYHLFFIDLLKRKRDYREFTADEKQKYDQFDKNYGRSALFYEVETQMIMVNHVQDKDIHAFSEGSSKKEVQEVEKVFEHLRKFYTDGHYNSPSTPSFMRPQDLKVEGNPLIGQQFEEQIRTEYFSQASYFKGRAELIKQAQNHINSRNYSKGRYVQSDVEGFENDLNWNKLESSELIWQYARDLQGRSDDHRSTNFNQLNFWEITNPSFFEKLADYFSMQYNQKRWKLNGYKFRAGFNFYTYFTIEQMDMLAKNLNSGLNPYNIHKRDHSFTSVYISKVFAEELSEEYQETLNLQQKYDMISNLHSHCKAKGYKKSLLNSLFREMMILTIKLEQFNEKMFKEYLKQPVEQFYQFKKDKMNNLCSSNRSDYNKWDESLRHIKQDPYLSTCIITTYLEHLCFNKYAGSLKEYSSLFEEHYLKNIEADYQVYYTNKGIVGIESHMSPQQYIRVSEEVKLEFSDTNKEKFEVEEGVSLKVKLKNIPKLTIKVFEFNTETYYKKNMKPFDTSVNLHGLEPSFTRTVDDLKDIPPNMIVNRTFHFNELKDRIGLFIIELMGNGKMSRCVIKKGQLTLIHKSTLAGHLCYLIDHNKKICKGDNTGVWFNKKFYKCRDDSQGEIFIPYAKTMNQGKIIMMHNGFAQLGEFLQKAETYEFSCYMHLVSESVLVGQEAKILIRPKLMVNKRMTSVKFLKNAKVELRLREFIDDTETNKTYQVKFKDDEDTVLSFQVPANVSFIEARVTCEIMKVTTKQLQNLPPITKNWSVQQHSNSNRIKELYLRKEGKEYYIYCLGRNGEPIRKEDVRVTCDHKDYRSNETRYLKTDGEGKVGLGDLSNACKVSAYLQSESSVSEEWIVANHFGDEWTQANDIHILEGEEINIPVNVDQSKMPLHSRDVSLLYIKNEKVIQNLFSALDLQQNEVGTYYNLKLKGLKHGTYKLKLNLTSGQREKILITVHQGTVWQGNFILKRNNIFQSSSQKKAIKIEDVEAEPTEEEGKIKFKVSLSDYTQKSRLHIYTSQFAPNFSGSLRKEMEEAGHEEISITNFPFAKWKNMFEDNHTIGDEIKYVFDRANRENQMGNTLDKPSIFMKRNMVRTTTTEEENLKAGTNYAEHDLGRTDVQAHASMKNAALQAKNYAQSSKDSLVNKIKDYQNFQSSFPLQLFNLKPNDQGMVEFTIPEALSHSDVYIVGADHHSAVQRHLNLKEVLMTVKHQPIPKRDLTINKEQKENDKVGILDKRESQCLSVGDSVHIEDVTSSQFQIIDSHDKVLKVVKAMVAARHNPDLNYSKDERFSTITESVLLQWHSWDTKVRNQNYSKYVSHELNLFLFKTDQDFFYTTALPFIQNKMEKTFIDWYLIEMSSELQTEFLPKLLAFAELPGGTDKMNILEQCLLIEVCLKRGDEDNKVRARAIGQRILETQAAHEDAYSSYFKDGNLRTKLFTIVLGISGMEQDPVFDIIDYDEEDLEGMEYNPHSDSDSSSDDDRHNSFKKEGEVRREKKQDKRMKKSARAGHAPRMQQQQQNMWNQPQQMQRQNIQMAMGADPFDQMELEECIPPPPGAMPPQPMYAIAGASMKSMMCQNIMPASMQYREEIHEKKCDEEEDEEDADMGGLFGDDCDDDSYGCGGGGGMTSKHKAIIEEAYEEELNKVAFQEIEKTQEFMETHYYDEKDAKSHPEFYSTCRLFSAYVEYLLQEKFDQPFLSDCFIDLPPRYLPLAFSLLDLKFESKKQPQDADLLHKYKSDKKRGIFITAATPAVIFKKEIKDGECKLKNDVLVMHRYLSQDRYNSGKEADKGELIMNTPYECEIILTNISNESKTLTLLYQIPNGSLPLMKTKYIQSKQISISSFHTVKEKITFYFPADGQYQHAQTNVSLDNHVIAKSPLELLEVGKKRVISKIETFQDLMMTTPDKDEKKKLILDIMKNKEGIYSTNKDYGFALRHIYWLIYDDAEFYFKVMEILDEQMYYDNYMSQYIFKFFGDACKRPELAKYRELAMNILVDHLEADDKLRKFKQYMFKPYKFLMFSRDAHELFDIENLHLEYFPIVNQRVFQIGQLEQASDEQKNAEGYKKILNYEFRETYNRLLYLAIHQDMRSGFLDLPPQMKLKFAYYLQLQDRIKEAKRVFKEVKPADFEQSLGQHACEIAYDYMACYFEFYIEGSAASVMSARRLKQSVTIVRDIVKKYEKLPILHHFHRFKAIRDQLNEIEESLVQSGTPQMPHSGDDPVMDDEGNLITAEQTEEITDEQRKQAVKKSAATTPSINDVKIHAQTGEITIEQENIAEFTVKYYLIDTEILFSRSPFIKDEAKEFSYVQPFFSLTKPSDGAEQVKIALPDHLKGKNMVIEVGSQDEQRFLTYYSSMLKVQINEAYGELHVYNHKTMQPLPRIYVKVFCKKSGGDELFFRDGFTDIRGKFEYANASGISLDSIVKFSIFVSDDNHGLGQLIKEAGPPKK